MVCEKWYLQDAVSSVPLRCGKWTLNPNTICTKKSKHLIEFRSPEFLNVVLPSKIQSTLRLVQVASSAPTPQFVVMIWQTLFERVMFPCSISQMVIMRSPKMKIEIPTCNTDDILVFNYRDRGKCAYAKVWDHQRDQLWAPATDADSLWDRSDTPWQYSVHGHLKNSAWQVVDVLNIQKHIQVNSQTCSF